VVFVCNHYELYGPMSAAVGLPYDFRPWIDNNVLDKEKTYNYVYKNSMQTKRIPECFKKLWSSIAEKIGTWALNSFNPVPVKKDSLKELKETFEVSADALINGDNLLIFPENSHYEPDGKYNRNGVSTFYSGFARIGRDYYDKTGKSITFYPIYSDKKHHTLTFGNAVTFNPNNPSAIEKHRIVTELNNALITQSETNKINLKN
ncbi:MAG: hypothetical protein RR054_01600, partial [Clostridia bacterium]